MKAVRIHQFGDPAVLHYEDVPAPVIKRGQVLIQVYAAGINPVDYKTRQGNGIANADDLPLILGWDVAGVVVQAGEEAALAVGDRVFGMVAFPKIGSAYAEFVAADSSDLARLPENIDMISGGAIPLVGLTGWQALFDAAGLQTGERILIHAAAGGVGHIAVQLAKWRGAYVIGTASARNHDYLRTIGVDETIDYTTRRFEEVVNSVDVVLNTQRDDTLARSLSVLGPKGRLISVAGRPDNDLARQRGVYADSILVSTNGAQMEQIAGLMAAGLLKPTVEHILPLSLAAEAHRLQESGHIRGKIVLQIKSE